VVSTAICRSYEAFKQLHLGLISEVKINRSAIAQVAGLDNAQSLHHFHRIALANLFFDNIA